MDAPMKGKGKISSKGTTSKAKARPPTQMVYMPGNDPEFEIDPSAFPPDSDNGEDGYMGWDVQMDLRDLA